MVTKQMMRDFFNVLFERDVAFKYGKITQAERDEIISHAIKYYFKDNSLCSIVYKLDIYELSGFIKGFLYSNNLKRTEDGIFLNREDFKDVESFEKLFSSVMSLEGDPDESCLFLSSFNDNTNLQILEYLHELYLREKDNEVLKGLISCISSDLERLIDTLNTSGKSKSQVDDWTDTYYNYLSNFNNMLLPQ